MNKINYKEFHGLVLYKIELDGCLNGVYTMEDNRRITTKKENPAKKAGLPVWWELQGSNL